MLTLNEFLQQNHISKYTDEEIKGNAITRIILTTMRYIYTEDIDDMIESILKALLYLSEIEDKQKGIEYFETFMKYIFSAKPNLTVNNFDEIVKKMEGIYIEGSEIAMTLRELFVKEGLEQGIEKGIEKGIEQGIEKGIEQGEYRKSLNHARKLLTKKFGKLPEVYIKKLNNADTEILDLIVEDILALQALEDIDKYL